ncbi:MAG: rod-binding protein [Longimicrobiales bacterium]|nr:rod-binding protein [Longimicrobiales bacterium]
MIPSKITGVLDPTAMTSSHGADRVDSSHSRRLERLRQAAEDMEAVFMHHLTSAMRATVPGGGHPDAPGADMYASMLDEHLADALAADTNTGIAEALYRQLSANFGLDVAAESAPISERSAHDTSETRSRATSSSEGV